MGSTWRLNNEAVIDDLSKSMLGSIDFIIMIAVVTFTSSANSTTTSKRQRIDFVSRLND